MKIQRINKILANYGICLGGKTDKIIRSIKILINGFIAEIGINVYLYSDFIHMNGKEFKTLKIFLEVILLHKPKNVIMTCSVHHNRKYYNPLP